MSDRFGTGEALFSCKCFAAAMLAYYLALQIGLTRPYWAVTTSYIVAQPLAGAVLSKAVFRVGGTFLGAAAAVVLVPAFVNEPAVLALALALWLGLCLYVSLLDRTPRAYFFLLAGYTASIIGFPSVAAPGAIFEVAILRVQEITIGILCGSLVHGLVFPQTVSARLLARIDAILADAERWTADALAATPDPRLDADRRRLALDIGELHQLSIHLPFDTARLLPRVRTVRALQDQLSLILPLASAADDRMTVLARNGEPLPPAVAALIEQVRGWLARHSASGERTGEADTLIAAARALEPGLAAPLNWRDALVANLLARLADLIAAHRDVRDLRDQMHAPTRAPVTPRAGLLIAQAGGRALHRDRALAVRSAFGTIATMLLGSLFWIATGWSDGAGAVLIAGVCCALFGSADNPGKAIFVFLEGTVLGLVVAAIYAYALLPQATSFAVLAGMLAPTLLVMGALLARPAWTLLMLGTLLGFLNTVGLNDRQAQDFAAFVNGGLAQLVGTAFAVVTVGLFQTVGSETAVARIMRAGWRELARAARSKGVPDEIGWVSRMLDRLGLLAPRLAAQGGDPGRPLLDVLADLRVGVVLGDLRRVAIAARGRLDPAVRPVLDRVSRFYAGRSRDPAAAPPADLLAAIDGALADLVGVAHAEPGESCRDGVLALVSLRRNLFPADRPVGVVGA